MTSYTESESESDFITWNGRYKQHLIHGGMCAHKHVAQSK